MKKIIYIVCTLLFASCNEFLDVKPVGKLIPSKVADFENLLNHKSTYEFLMHGGNYDSPLMPLTDNVFISDEMVKGYYYAGHSLLHFLSGYSLYSPLIDPNTTDQLYGKMYKATSYFNSVIDGMTELKAENDPVGIQLIAQARAGRAWSYLHLGMMYGQMYNPSGDNNTPTIAYRKTSDATQPNPKLSTVKELFDLAEEDFLFAIENAPEKFYRPVRASKATAKALLAELYMYKGNFEDMYKYASESWEMLLKELGGADNLLYDYNQFYYTGSGAIQPGEDPESRQSLESKQDKIYNQYYHREMLFFRQAAFRTFSFKLTDDYLNNFTAGDLRRKLFVLKKVGASGSAGGIDYSDGVIEQDFFVRVERTQGISSSYLLLMVAEAAARTNRTTEALNALQTLRKYRYDSSVAEVAEEWTRISKLSGDELTNEVLNERRRELPPSLGYRYFDMRRFAYETGKPWCKKELVRTILGKEYRCEITSTRMQFVFENAVISYNPSWGLMPNTKEWLPYSQFQ